MPYTERQIKALKIERTEYKRDSSAKSAIIDDLKHEIDRLKNELRIARDRIRAANEGKLTEGPPW